MHPTEQQHRPAAPPSHIILPPPPVFLSFSLQVSPDENSTPDCLQFHTAPSTPSSDLSSPPSPALPFFTPPTSPYAELVLQSPPASDLTPSSLLISVPHMSPRSREPPTQDPLTDDAFPVAIDVAMDLVLDDKGLSALEKIYLYSTSKASFHRIFIAHALPDFLQQTTPQEAVDYVLPLLSRLAMDDDEKVREAFTAGLVPIIWWFFTHCQIIPDDLQPDESYASSSTTVTISVQAFTPILGTLLLSPSGDVSKQSRTAVVQLLWRMKKIDDIEMGISEDQSDDQSGADFDPDDEKPFVGLFRKEERLMFRQEILQQVVIGMGRLDVDLVETDDILQAPQSPLNHHFGEQARQTVHSRDAAGEADQLNPYFPAVLRGAENSPSSHSGNSSQAGSTFFPSGNSVPAGSHPSLPFPPQDLAVEAAAHRGGHVPHGEHEYDREPYGSEGGEDEQQAAVGRLSSMSLMAAVTASGSLGEETKLAFVREVERVGRDPFSYVRCEASYVLGALAKVVPEEVVTTSLLPLFHSLQSDVNLHVRYSSVFALPAILSRLSPDHRQALALRTIVSLSSDENEIVRSGALEVLGEVLHTFQNDRNGPPKQLVHLFLGRTEDRRVRDGQQGQNPPSGNDPLESFYQDPGRPLTCAFNFPAVALTLGPSRWDELRDAYADIANNRSSKVRRTLAASLGKMAEIIGQKRAQRDLISVWWDAIRCEEEEVRTKVVESSEVLIEVVGKAAGTILLQGLLTVWEEGIFKGWRERDAITKRLLTFAHMLGEAIFSIIGGLLLKALEDDVAGVRETAISILPRILSLFAPLADVSAALEANLQKLAKSTMYRKRMTFIACQQARLLSVGGDGGAAVASDLDFLMSVSDLSNDLVEGVRIGVARFTTIIYERFIRDSRPIPPILVKLVQQFSGDSSQEVQSYVPDLTRNILTHGSDIGGSTPSNPPTRPWAAEAATFSRPPPFRVRRPIEEEPWPLSDIKSEQRDSVQSGQSFVGSGIEVDFSRVDI